MDVKSLSTVAPARLDPVGQTPGAGSAAASARGAAVASGTGANGDAAAVVTRLAYTSPFAQYDPKSRLEILQFRDTTTGKVLLQVPAEKVVAAYRRIAEYGQGAVGTDPTSAAARTAAEADRRTGDDTKDTAQTGPAGTSTAPSTGAADTGTTANSTEVPSLAEALAKPADAPSVPATPAPQPQLVTEVVPLPRAPVSAPTTLSVLA